MDSILNSVKSYLGIEEASTDFDQDIIVFINAALGILHLLGVGSPTVYSITDYTTKWTDFLGATKDFELVKTYVFAKVRLIFDPPTLSFLVSAYQGIIAEAEFRLADQASTLEIEARPVVINDEGV